MMKLLALVLAPVVVAFLLTDPALAQGRGGNGARNGAGGSGHAVTGGGGYHRGHHGGYGGARYWGGYRGWYGPGVGIYLGGAGYWGPWAYPYPYGAYAGYYGYPGYAMVYPSEPMTYVEDQAASVGYWYYCRDPAGYFPYVQTCSGTWMTVVPPREHGRPASPALAAP